MSELFAFPPGLSSLLKISQLMSGALKKFAANRTQLIHISNLHLAHTYSIQLQKVNSSEEITEEKTDEKTEEKNAPCSYIC